MKRKIIPILAMLGSLIIAVFAGPASAELPVTIDLQLTKTYFGADEAIPATVMVANATGETLWISKGFESMIYYLEMRVIDPAGRALLPKRLEETTESPDAPPLAYVLTGAGEVVRVAGCEELLSDQ